MKQGTRLTPKEVKDIEVQIISLVKDGFSLAKAHKSLGVSKGWVYNRRKKNTGFDDALKAALEGTSKEKATPTIHPSDDWVDNFIAEFVETGGQKTKAAARVGKTMIEVMQYLNPTHPFYNQEFVEKLREAETVVTEVMLDEARRRGMDKSNQMLIQCLQWLDPDRFGDKKGDSGELPFQVNITLQSEERAMKTINAAVLNEPRRITAGNS